MKVKVKDIADVAINDDTVSFKVVLDKSYRQNLLEAVNAFSVSDKPFMLTLEQQKQQRSLNANAYCWVLCEKIAQKAGTTKEVVYQKNIREVGSFDVMEIAEKAVARFIERWRSNGLGWQAEPIGEVKNGYINVIAYYGSSTYTTAEMARLIDAIIEEAKNLQIETLPPDEIERLKTAWKGG